MEKPQSSPSCLKSYFDLPGLLFNLKHIFGVLAPSRGAVFSLGRDSIAPLSRVPRLELLQWHCARDSLEHEWRCKECRFVLIVRVNGSMTAKMLLLFKSDDVTWGARHFILSGRYPLYPRHTLSPPAPAQSISSFDPFSTLMRPPLM